jgi:hypothetical protein
MSLIKINKTYFINTEHVTHVRYGEQHALDATHGVWAYLVSAPEPIYIPCKSELDMIRALHKLGARVYEEG